MAHWLFDALRTECKSNTFNLNSAFYLDIHDFSVSSRQVSPIQLLREFQTYQELIRRPIVAQILQAERETMLGYLEASLKEVSNHFNVLLL